MLNSSRSSCESSAEQEITKGAEAIILNNTRSSRESSVDRELRKIAEAIMLNSTRSSRESSYDNLSCDSSQTSSIADQLPAVTDRELCTTDFWDCCVLQCMTCNTVLGDSLGICGEIQSLKSIICLNVTEDVRVNEKVEMSLNRHLASSTYQAVLCAGCQASIGLVLHSTPEHLSALRNLFLLRKDLINCYMLTSGTCVKASKINFQHQLMDKSIKELKLDLEAQLKQVTILEEIMGKLYTQCRLKKWQA